MYYPIRHQQTLVVKCFPLISAAKIGEKELTILIFGKRFQVSIFLPGLKRGLILAHFWSKCTKILTAYVSIVWSFSFEALYKTSNYLTLLLYHVLYINVKLFYMLLYPWSILSEILWRQLRSCLQMKNQLSQFESFTHVYLRILDYIWTCVTDNSFNI